MNLYLRAFGLVLCIFLMSACANKPKEAKNSGTSAKFAKKANERFGLVNFYILKFNELANGKATWYKNGTKRKTSSGELYNENGFTAAHKTLPFNTIVRVTNIQNGRTSSVRINDRMAEDSKNVLFVSKASAKELGMNDKAHALVELEIIAYALCPNERNGKLTTCIINPPKKDTGVKDKEASSVGVGKFIDKDKKQLDNGILVQIGAYKIKKWAEVQEKKGARYRNGIYNSFMKVNAKTGWYEVFLSGFESLEQALKFIRTPAFCDDFVLVDGKVVKYSKNICTDQKPKKKRND